MLRHGSLPVGEPSAPVVMVASGTVCPVMPASEAGIQWCPLHLGVVARRMSGLKEAIAVRDLDQRVLKASDAPLGTVWDLDVLPSGREDRFYLWMKRALDIVISLLALALLAPLLLLIALAVTLDSPGPVFFVQERVGYDRRRRRPKGFYMVKFRSMAHNCDQSVHQKHVTALINGHDGSGNGAALAKLTNDGRVTRVGRFLRKTSLDELPQFWNVLVGEMSLVGPRPPIAYEVSLYQAWQKVRLQVTPGITGIWQVNGRSRVSLDDMVRMDLDYVARRSLWLDIVILLKTPLVVITGWGAD